ncbi:MAG: chemotaxis protein CheB, partial [Octadecabacter sp.]
MDISTDANDILSVVGIGASAGGLDALGDFLDGAEQFSGAAFIVVQHLSPDQDSMLHELLKPHTKMPIHVIVSGMHLAANQIFVAPPGKVVSIQGDNIVLNDRQAEESPHKPIDLFFTSLALERSHNAYCVVLSGTGTDGAAGLRAIKANGGFAFAQTPEDAGFAGMPESAIATGLVDVILPALAIAKHLADIIEHKRSQYISDAGEQLTQEIKAALPEISKIIAKWSGHNFTDYKPGTLVRRVERRMNLMRISDVSVFCEAINTESDARSLAQEFMISVTQFFRDPETFDALRRLVVGPLLDNASSTIRIWVPGCATGEEVYTLAILFHEEMDKRSEHKVLQIFGTDIDLGALYSARQGRYEGKTIAHLRDERVEKFFEADIGGFRVKQELRDACIFTPHNLLQDPPFSRLDLISCRNLLIYLNSEIQKKILPRFHFGLRKQGFLLLGSAEGIGSDEDLFDVEDKNHRIYRRNDQTIGSYSALTDLKSRGEPRSAKAALAVQKPSLPTVGSDVSRDILVEREYLRNHANPFGLISKMGEILYMSQSMTKYVQPASGRPSNHIEAYLAPELRLPVRQTLEQAVETGNVAIKQSVIVLDQVETHLFDITIAPSGGDYLLKLSEVRTTEMSDLANVVDATLHSDRSFLEIENTQLRKQLAETLRQFENTGQDQKSLTEELTSMNDMLQSSNEELETSREELQSINEELETVNSELQANNRLLIRANSDLQNLFAATDIAVLFLDREHCVRSFTPRTDRLFGIRERDIGRPLKDLAYLVDYTKLEQDTSRVDQSLQMFEREVQSKDGTSIYLLRIKPYRTIDNRLDGYVLSFVDITDLKEKETQIAQQYGELENIYNTTPVGLSLIDRDFRWLRINDSLAEINGFSVAEHIGRTFNELLPDLDDLVSPMYNQVFETGEPVRNLEIKGETAAAPGVERDWIADFYPVRHDGEIFAIGACVREVTEQAQMVTEVKAQNELQKLLMGELHHRVKNTLTIISSISKFLLKGVDDPAVYQERLEDRLSAIARTHDLLTVSNWTSATVSGILESESKPYQTGRGHIIRMTGPDIQLSADQAMPFGMAIHELFTNAAKYGALSVETGVIFVNTFTDVKDGVSIARIEWRESGGPKIMKAPKNRGFGSLI